MKQLGDGDNVGHDIFLQ